MYQWRSAESQLCEEDVPRAALDLSVPILVVFGQSVTRYLDSTMNRSRLWAGEPKRLILFCRLREP